MTTKVQGSFFEQGLMAPPERSFAPDPKAVRGRLERLLERLRAAETMPLAEREVRMWRTVVPNMTKWLPDDEARSIQDAFEREMARLDNAA